MQKSIIEIIDDVIISQDRYCNFQSDVFGFEIV